AVSFHSFSRSAKETGASERPETVTLYRVPYVGAPIGNWVQRKLSESCVEIADAAAAVRLTGLKGNAHRDGDVGPIPYKVRRRRRYVQSVTRTELEYLRLTQRFVAQFHIAIYCCAAKVALEGLLRQHRPVPTIERVNRLAAADLEQKVDL